jgi:hypothetical protein
VGVVGFKKKIEKEFPRKNNVEEKKNQTMLTCVVGTRMKTNKKIIGHPITYIPNWCSHGGSSFSCW